MPTTSERQALVFVAALAVVGAGVRVASARRFARDVNVAAGVARTDSGSPAARALEAQIAAVDSARAANAHRGSKTGSARRRNSSDRRERPTPQRDAGASDDRPVAPSARRSSGRARAAPPSSDHPIDINSASASQLETLPRVGPALAKRIVAWRNANGPFSSEEDLRHVPGIGVTTAALLVPLVTFSSGYRPFQSEARPSRHYPDLPAI